MEMGLLHCRYLMCTLAEYHNGTLNRPETG